MAKAKPRSTRLSRAVEKLGGSGYELVGGTQEQFTALVKKELAKWADVVKRSGAKVD